MSKEFEEELLAPSSHLHLPGDRTLVWMSFQDVESHSAYKRQILWCMILAGACIVFVEDHIELPVKIVLNAPVQSDDLQNTARRHVLGQRNVMDGCFRLAIGLAPFAVDAREHDQARQGRSVLGCGNGGDAAALESAMSFLAFLVRCDIAALVGLGKSRNGAGMKRSIIALEFQCVMRPTLAQRRSHFRMAVQGVGGYGTALQIQALKGFERRFHLIPVATGPRGQRVETLVWFRQAKPSGAFRRPTR